MTDKLLARMKRVPRKQNYKTTSFTMLRADYEAFIKLCDRLDHTPSVVLREFVLLFIEENSKGVSKDYCSVCQIRIINGKCETPGCEGDI